LFHFADIQLEGLILREKIAPADIGYLRFLKPFGF